MRLLVIRGDLQSQSGYSAAARAYAALLAPMFDRHVGVDIHFSSDRPFQAFLFPVRSESEAIQLAGEAKQALVLSFTTPDCYLCYPGSANVGLTFWETDRLPERSSASGWVDQANRMDGLWLPSTHTRDVFTSSGVTCPMRLIPWPTTAAGIPPPGLPEGEVYNLDRRPCAASVLSAVGNFRETRFRWARWLTRKVSPRAAKELLAGLRTSPESIPSPEQRVLLCVAQDVPRKGLPLLLSEWMEFKRRPEAQEWALILKSSPIDPRTSRFAFVSHFWRLAQGLKRQLGVAESGVFLWTGNLAEADYQQLLANTFGHISATLGEGFCGPLALSLSLGKPVAAPRHSAIADYLPPDYPYCFSSRPTRIRFAHDMLRVYDPASVWHVPEPGALANALSRLVTEPAERRNEICWRASAHLSSWCSPDRVQNLLMDEVARLLGTGAYRAA